MTDLRARLETLILNDILNNKRELIRPIAEHLSRPDGSIAPAVLARLLEPLVRLALPAETPAPETPPADRTCATCRHWDDDGESAECNNPDSPMYRVSLRDDREPWHEDWSCSLFAAKGPETPADPPPALHPKTEEPT